MTRSKHHDRAIKFIHDNASNSTSLRMKGAYIENVGRTLQTFLPMLEQKRSKKIYICAFHQVKRIKDELIKNKI